MSKPNTHLLKRLTRRQAAIRSAFKASYPSSVNLIELFASTPRSFDIIAALARGRTYREVAAVYNISIAAIYDREVRFYVRAEKYLTRNPDNKRLHPLALRVKHVLTKE